MDSTKICQQNRMITGRVWCDDHSDVYIGSCKKLYRNVASMNHPIPESFEAKASCCDYVYFVCWSNDTSVNGFLAELQGTLKRVTGSHAKWQVLPTGIDFDSSKVRPSLKLINEQLEKANCEAWKAVTVGQPNTKANKPFANPISGIDINARYIWHNSGKDIRNAYPNSPYVPFAGFNHDEFLIFRFPVKELFPKECHDCDCGCDCKDDCHCSKCSGSVVSERKALQAEAQEKTFIIKGKGTNAKHCKTPYSGENCTTLDVPRLEPCFYLHWGDGPKDQMETHDDEVLYITACNPYGNLTFRGLKITKIYVVYLNRIPIAQAKTDASVVKENVPQIPSDILPIPIPITVPVNDGSIQLVPNRLLELGDLCGCSCASQATYLSIQNAKAQNYEIHLEYCIDQIEINQEHTGKTSFPITLVKS
jgi:hypothetical protein